MNSRIAETSRRLFAIAFLLVGSCQVLVAQLEEKFPTRKVSDFNTNKPNYCWYNNMQLDQISQGVPKDKTLIIIARLGIKERNAKLNKRRLENVRTFLTEGVMEQFRRSPDSIIIAEGERTSDYGHVEFYLDGRLIEMLIPYSNADIGVAECYAGIDGDPWCKTPRQKLFFPCKDHVKKKAAKAK